MEELKEIVTIFNVHQIQKLELFSLSKKKQSKINRMFQLYYEDKVSSDQEAFEELYPEHKGELPNSAYRNLKANLKKRLLNTTFFIIPDKQASDRQKAYTEAYKYLAASKIYMSRSAQKASIEYLKKTLKIAQKYEFTTLALLASRDLRNYSGSHIGNLRQYKEFCDTALYYQQLDRLEDKAAQYYNNLIIYYAGDLSPKQELQALAWKYLQELEQDVKETTSYSVELYMLLIHLFHYTCINNYHMILDLCDEKILFFREKPYEARTPIQICLHHQLVACLQKRDLDQGESIAKQSNQYLEAGTFNWFKTQEYLVLIALHAGTYKKAYEYFTQTVEHSRFDYLPEQILELWKLYQAYLQLLIKARKFIATKYDNRFSHFRINRFVNDMPIFSKDKRGVNVVILILQFSYFVITQNYDFVIDRADALKRYSSRYLFDKNTMRSYYFIKMLLAIPKGNFHHNAVKRHSKADYVKMKKITPSMTHEHHKLEILPYEHLWELLLENLDYDIIIP